MHATRSRGRCAPGSRALALAATTVTLALISAPATAAAPARAHTWGPRAVPFVNGSVCTSPDDALSTALLSWRSPATAQPAYALGPIVAAADGAATTPAVDATSSVAATTASSGLSRWRLAALAYLLGHDGASTQPAAVAEVAALVADDPASAACLATVPGGRAGAAELFSRAARLAGPYTVRIDAPPGRLRLARPTVVTARVLSATGVGVPGLPVHIASDDPSVGVDQAAVATDAEGRVRATVRVPSASTATQVRLSATTQATTGLLQMSAPGEVPLVAAGSPRTWAASRTLRIDTTAHPAVSVRPSRSFVLPGASVRPRVVVTGMRGHLGTASVQVAGPVPFRRATGCSSYAPARWHGRAVHDVAITDGLQVVGDGSYATAPLTLAGAGCYLLRSSVRTVNAIPAASASAAADRDAVIAVAPLAVSVTPPHGGVSLAGSLHATIALRGFPSAHVGRVAGSVVGPLPEVDGHCPHTGWTTARTAGALTVQGGDGATARALATPRLDRAGCYAFRVQARVVLPHLGVIDLATAPSAATMVLAPTVSATALSASEVRPGQPIRATVVVAGTGSTPGRIGLELARLPYTYRGCYGLDWSSAAVRATPMATVTASRGDGRYTVTSPGVPDGGCWTVRPVFTLDADPSATVSGALGASSMLAFSVPERQATRHPTATAARIPAVDRSWSRPVTAAVAASVLVLLAVLITIVVARHSDDADLA